MCNVPLTFVLAQTHNFKLDSFNGHEPDSHSRAEPAHAGKNYG